MKWGQRTKFDELVPHKARLAQRQLFHQGTRLSERGYVQEENRACLRLANPPLVDLASQIQSKRSRHFIRKELLYLFRCWRLRELSDSQNFCCRDHWENALRHFLWRWPPCLERYPCPAPTFNTRCLSFVRTSHLFFIRVYEKRVTATPPPVNPFLFPSIREYR